MASRSWFDRTNDDVTAWWFRDLIRRGVISDQADSNQRERQRRRPNRFKRWLLLERRRGLRKQSYFALVVEVGLSLAVIGLLIGLTLHVIGPVLFGIGCCLLIPSAFWFVWEFSYRTTEELERGDILSPLLSHHPPRLALGRHYVTEASGHLLSVSSACFTMATTEGDASGAMAASPGSRTERAGILHKCRATLERATNLVKSVVMLLTVLACIMIISALTIDSEQTDRQSKMVLFGIGVGCFLQGLAYLIYLVWYTSSGRHSTSITLRPEYVPSVGRRRHVRHR
ncbi:hypothetical protein Bbelb_216130 [Branchiostoma belcheri]|nr:hypothetical protein Bbelb_216130 [Branchiostoma belcheri]